uniref:HNH endonuclease n=1 Tax=Synechococcus sp. UW106 TaxID=368495 RepID=UPI000E0E6C50|nr:HNH endonuclease [Synechococcus sp. UW106]
MTSLQNLDTKQQFYEWMLAEGSLAEKSCKSYCGAISTISRWAEEEDVLTGSIYDVVDLSTYIEVKELASGTNEFVVRNVRSRKMFSCALDWYERFLRQNSVLTKIVQEKEVVLTTSSLALRGSRVGQGVFRRQLNEYWENKCSVTGYLDAADESILIGSHIKPWAERSNNERLDPFNGLLLTPNLDKLFDKGYVSFAGDGSIMISGSLESPGVLGVRSDMAISRLKLDGRHRAYLDYHRTELFKG